MHADTMRRIDRWLGIPTCAILTLSRRLGDLFRRRPTAEDAGSILFIKLAEQGSTVLAASAIRAAVERVGRERVHFLCFEENRFIVDAMDLVPRENVTTIDADGLAGTVVNALRALRRLRRLEFDVAIDLEFFARSTAAIGYLSGARRRIGLHAGPDEGPWRGDLLTHRLRYTPHLHTSRLFRLQVEAIDADPELLPTFDLVPPEADEPAPPIAATEEESIEVRRILDETAGMATSGPDSGPLVLLNANCSDLLPLRAWSRDRYVELANRLLEHDPTLRIGFTGAPAEAEGAEILVRDIDDDRCFLLAGRTTLRQLIVLYGLADLLVTNDSGPAHFASLTTIDVVTLFGPEHPRLFAARGPRNHVLHAGLACSPCVSALNNRTTPCQDNRCMQAITVDQVFEASLRVLDARARGDRPLPVVEIETSPVDVGRPAPAR
ncbi:MAG: glycosyltransferase family 9 protein [Phycisphaera sp.]|nr:glycosyltransferase family 9 protein [Phycisphaera sp.]